MSTLHIVTAFETTASVDLESRTITGIAVPYNVTGSPGGSFRSPLEFAPGAFSRSLAARAHRVRLIVDHDRSRPIGKLLDFEESPQGLTTRWKIASTPAGDQMLAEAADGIRDGLSVGADVIQHEVARDRVRVTEAKLIEVSLVAFPAFDAARVTRVAAHLIPAGRDPRTLRLRMTLEN